MEFTPSPSSIFQNKKIKYNNKKPTKNGIIWINFSKIRKARCTSLSHILLRFTTQNIAYTGTIYKITSSFPKCEMYNVTSQLRRAALTVVFITSTTSDHL